LKKKNQIQTHTWQVCRTILRRLHPALLVVVLQVQV